MDYSVGDRVAIEAGVYCGSCRLCKIGRYNLCPKSIPSLAHRRSSPTPLQCASPPPPRFTPIKTALSSPSSTTPFATSTSFPTRAHTNKLPLSSLSQSCSTPRAAQEFAQARASSYLVLERSGSSLAPSLRLMELRRRSSSTCRLPFSIVSSSEADSEGKSNEDRVNFAVKEGFATSGHVRPRAPRPETVAAGLEAANVTAQNILTKHGLVDTDGFDVVMECTGVESCMQAAIYASSLLATFVTSLLTTPCVDCSTRRKGRLYRHGNSQRCPARLRRRIPRSRPPRRLPLRVRPSSRSSPSLTSAQQHVPRCSGPLWCRPPAECREARDDAIPACEGQRGVRDAIEGDGREWEHGDEAHDWGLLRVAGIKSG